MADFFKLLREETFTFYVGPSQTTFNVHPSVFFGVSEPLYRMTVAGMLESHSKQTILIEADPEAFASLCEYAYTRSYREPVDEPHIQVDYPTHHRDFAFYKDLLGTGWHCRYCQYDEQLNNNWFPFCNADCESDAQSFEDSEHFCVACCAEMPPVGPYIYTHNPLCSDCDPSVKLPIYPLLRQYSTLVDFESGSDMSNRVDQFLERTAPHHAVKSRPISHAKLYVLADMYLIEELKQYSMCRLYKSLCDPEIHNAHGSELVPLLWYTYVTDGTATTACNEGLSLRQLVALWVSKFDEELRGETLLAGKSKFAEELRESLESLKQE